MNRGILIHLNEYYTEIKKFCAKVRVIKLPFCNSYLHKLQVKYNYF